MLDLVLSNKEGLVRSVKVKVSLGCCDHEIVEFKILRAVRRARSKLTTRNSGEQILASAGICFIEHHGIKPWGRMGPRKLVNIQGSPPPSSEVVHPDKEEVR